MTRSSGPDLATLSEAAHSPCPHPDQGVEPAGRKGPEAPSGASHQGLRALDGPPSDSDHLRYARLVKPFPVKKLPTVLHQVLEGAAVIHGRVTRMQVDGVWGPEDWHIQLDAIGNDLYALALSCQQADEALAELHDEGDRSYEMAIRAVQAMLRGM